MIDSLPFRDYLAGVWSLWKSLFCAAVLLGVVGDIHCFATDDDDCCRPAECALCAQSVVCVDPAPLLAASTQSSRLMIPPFRLPATPHLARLTPPPRPLA